MNQSEKRLKGSMQKTDRKWRETNLWRSESIGSNPKEYPLQAPSPESGGSDPCKFSYTT